MYNPYSIVIIKESAMLNHAQSPSVDAAAVNPFVSMPITGVVSPAIQRLIQEVRNKESVYAVGGKYDRTHNRHNRGQ